MNSQQELLDAINAISQNKDKSFDTPATVLRVEDDTVWVHIDGGADETPVNKTVNCEQGDTVQVRISNGSAFLVGNATAPPTDDKTATAAHFVAEQADIKAVKAEETATEVKETVEVLEVEVDNKVDIGTSNIQHLSSTMYQNANGVNIYNDTLAVGDSYAHIDGDSFDIKQATTAGTIDDANDIVLATFGANNAVIGRTDVEGGQYIKLQPSGLKILENIGGNLESGWVFDSNSISYDLSDNSQDYFATLYEHALEFLHTIGQSDSISANYEYNYAQLSKYISGVTSVTRIEADGIKMTGNVQDFNGNNKTPTILESTTISAATTSYTFTDNAITADSVIDIYDTIFGFAPTGMTVSAGSATITFPAQSTSHTIKLFVY